MWESLQEKRKESNKTLFFNISILISFVTFHSFSLIHFSAFFIIILRTPFHFTGTLFNEVHVTTYSCMLPRGRIRSFHNFFISKLFEEKNQNQELPSTTKIIRLLKTIIRSYTYQRTSKVSTTVAYKNLLYLPTINFAIGYRASSI